LINLYLTKRLIPSYSIKISFDRVWLPKLFRYGLADNARQIVNTIALQANRLILGFMMPASSLTFYTVPYSLLNRAFNFPGLILATLLPAFSATQKVGDRSSIHDLYLRANRYIMVFMMGITGLLAVFAREFLTIWISPAFAEKAYVVLILLCIGGFLASTYSALVTALQALNRPDIPAMIAAVNAILNILFCIILIPFWGVNGAALAWVCAFLLPTPFFLFFLHRNMLGISNRRFFLGSIVRPALVTILIIVLALFTRNLVRNLVSLILIGGTLGILYVLLNWFFVLDNKDRLTFSGYGLSMIRGKFSRPE
jgi:O-antigen/teichoic acid export membrane protein